MLSPTVAREIFHTKPSISKIDHSALDVEAVMGQTLTSMVKSQKNRP